MGLVLENRSYFIRLATAILVLFLMPSLSYGTDLASFNPYADKLDKVNKHFQEQQENSIEKIYEVIHGALDSSLPNETKKKAKGINDPHFPVQIMTKPRYFEVSSPLIELFSAQNDSFVSLQDFKPKVLNKLNKEQLRALVQSLSQVNLKIKWLDKEGNIRSGRKCNKNSSKCEWDKTNAAAALAIFMGASGQTKLLSKMMVLAPDAIGPELKSSLAALMDAKVAATVLVALIAEIDQSNAIKIAKEASIITEIYIKYWAEKDADKHVLALSSLVFETAKRVDKINFTFKQKGILLGAILSGTLLHVEKIRAQDEKRLCTVNAIANLAWAATTFIDFIPLVAEVSISIVGILSLASVVWPMLYEVRDFTPRIKEIEGHIEMAALSLTENNSQENKLNILLLLSWMRGAIHINGLSD